jgi:hypothetical protein
VIRARAGQLVYRVWGGTATKNGNPARAGVCLSSDKPSSRTAAEKLFAIWEWGNSCLWLTTFEVVPGTVMHIGVVHPGEFAQSGFDRGGVQVFIEQPIDGKLWEISTERLRDDLAGAWVSTRSGRA